MTLHLPVDLQGFETVTMLLDAGADVNCQHKDLLPPQIKACGRGNVKIVTLLIEIGAELPATLIGMLRRRYQARNLASFVDVFIRFGKNVRFTDGDRRNINDLLQLQSDIDLKRLVLSLEWSSHT